MGGLDSGARRMEGVIRARGGGEAGGGSGEGEEKEA